MASEETPCASGALRGRLAPAAEAEGLAPKQMAEIRAKSLSALVFTGSSVEDREGWRKEEGGRAYWSRYERQDLRVAGNRLGSTCSFRERNEQSALRSTVLDAGKALASRLHSLERRGMLFHLLAFHHRLATRRDGIRIVEMDRQSMHVRFGCGVDAAGLVEIKAQRFGIRGLEKHARPIAKHAVMGQGQLAAL